MFGDSLYAIAQVSADPEVKQWASKIERPRKALQVLVAARTEADDRTVIAEAALDRSFGVMEARAEVLERKVSGVFAEEPKKAAVIFKATTKKTFNSSVTTRNSLLEELSRAVGKPGLHSDLKGPAKEFVEARRNWLAAAGVHEAAQDAEADAIEAIGAGKRAVIAGMVEVHGLLRAKYATNAKRAETYFRKRQKKVTASERATANAARAAKAAEKAKADSDAKAARAAKAAEKAKAARGGAPA